MSDLKKVYRQAPKMKSPAHLDETILQAANNARHAAEPVRKRESHWKPAMAFASICTVGIAVGLILQGDAQRERGRVVADLDLDNSSSSRYSQKKLVVSRKDEQIVADAQTTVSELSASPMAMESQEPAAILQLESASLESASVAAVAESQLVESTVGTSVADTDAQGDAGRAEPLLAENSLKVTPTDALAKVDALTVETNSNPTLADTDAMGEPVGVSEQMIVQSEVEVQQVESLAIESLAIESQQVESLEVEGPEVEDPQVEGVVVQIDHLEQELNAESAVGIASAASEDTSLLSSAPILVAESDGAFKGADAMASATSEIPSAPAGSAPAQRVSANESARVENLGEVSDEGLAEGVEEGVLVPIDQLELELAAESEITVAGISTDTRALASSTAAAQASSIAPQQSRTLSKSKLNVDAHNTWLLQQNSESFTIQLAVASERQSLSSLARKLYFPTRIIKVNPDVPQWILVHGSFELQQKAEEIQTAIEPVLIEKSAAQSSRNVQVVRFGKLQQLVNK